MVIVNEINKQQIKYIMQSISSRKNLKNFENLPTTAMLPPAEPQTNKQASYHRLNFLALNLDVLKFNLQRIVFGVRSIEMVTKFGTNLTSKTANDGRRI